MLPNVRALLVCLLTLFAASADAAIVRGVVTSSAGGSALSGSVVAAYDGEGALRASASTDARGQYILTLPPGSYRLLGYDPQGTYATVFYGNAESFETTAFVQVVDGAPADANFALPPGGTVSGWVSSATAALDGAVVEAYNLSGTRRGFATTDASGYYSLVLPAGHYKIFAYAATDFFAGEFAFNERAFADAALVRVDPPAATEATFVLERAARVSGTVVDAQTRAPLAGKLVYAYTAAGSFVATTTTDAGGAFSFSLGPWQYRFVAGDPSLVYAPSFYAEGRSFERSDVVTLVAGEQRPNVTLAAERGGIVRGRVNGGARFIVAAYNLDGTQHTSATASDEGYYALVVAPGQYKLTAFDPTGVYAPQFHAGKTTFAEATELTILVGQTLFAIDFTPLRAGHFAGSVRDASTLQPLGGMTIAAYEASGVRVAETTTGANGVYVLYITPGQFRLVAFDTRLEYATAYVDGATSYEAAVPQNVDAGGVRAAAFVMRRGTRVSGTVADQSGAAIDGMEVFAYDAAGNRVAGATTTGGGAFTLVVLQGTYRFAARDPGHRYATSWVATPVTVGSTPSAPLTFTMLAVTRRRTVRS